MTQNMDDAAKRARMDAFRRICRERGLRCTVQRRVVLETVLDLNNHPTADDVYEVVSGRLEGISRTTVYRSLESLARTGVITKACHPGATARYDRRTEMHHHLICLRCDGIVDITEAGLDGLPIPDTSAYGFDVEDYRVQLRGICHDCREKEKKEETE